MIIKWVIMGRYQSYDAPNSLHANPSAASISALKQLRSGSHLQSPPPPHPSSSLSPSLFLS